MYNNPAVRAALEEFIPYTPEILRERLNKLSQSSNERIALDATKVAMQERRMLVEQVADVSDKSDEMAKAAEEAIERLLKQGDIRQKGGDTGTVDMGDRDSHTSSSDNQV